MKRSIFAVLRVDGSLATWVNISYLEEDHDSSTAGELDYQKVHWTYVPKLETPCPKCQIWKERNADGGIFFQTEMGVNDFLERCSLTESAAMIEARRPCHTMDVDNHVRSVLSFGRRHSDADGSSCAQV